jgi:hypothetical protein
VFLSVPPECGHKPIDHGIDFITTRSAGQSLPNRVVTRTERENESDLTPLLVMNYMHMRVGIGRLSILVNHQLDSTVTLPVLTEPAACAAGLGAAIERQLRAAKASSQRRGQGRNFGR